MHLLQISFLHILLTLLHLQPFTNVITLDGLPLSFTAVAGNPLYSYAR